MQTVFEKPCVKAGPGDVKVQPFYIYPLMQNNRCIAKQRKVGRGVDAARDIVKASL